MIPAPLDFAMLKTTVPIARVLAAKGLMAKLRRHGDRLVGPCPVHGGDNPRAFVVDPRRNLWYCFSRGHGGDVVELVRQLDHVGYAAAARTLAALANRPMVGEEPDVHWPADAPPRRPFRPYTRSLRLGPECLFLRRKGIRPATAASFEAGLYTGPGFLARCVGVRLRDPGGRPLGYAGRRLDPVEVHRYGKWKLPRGLPKARILYGYHRLRARPPEGLVLVECPWGVMRLLCEASHKRRYAQSSLMRSRRAQSVGQTPLRPAPTPHNYRRLSRAISLSGGLKLPLRRLGGTTASRVSSLSTGSSRR